MKKEIELLEAELTELGKFSRLIYEKGMPLEDSIEQIFKVFNLNYERLKDKRPYDFIIKDLFDSGKIFVEVTGQKHKIKRSNSKVSQNVAIYQAEEFNPDTDKILFLVNC
ncbi:MAG: hypothetical protein ACFFBD_30495, partial [Candidatus Hodarchaeota archaeon]